MNIASFYSKHMPNLEFSFKVIDQYNILIENDKYYLNSPISVQ